MKKDIQILVIASIAIITTLQLDARKVGIIAKPAELKKEIKQDTKALEKALKESEKAKTAQEKAAAQKTAYELAQDLLADLKEERTLIGDIYSGYTPQQITKARRAIARLEPLRKKVVADLAQKERDLKDVTDKGWLWNGPKPLKEKEYDLLSIEVNKLKKVLARIDGKISDQKVIAGDEWSNAFRALVAAGVITTAAVGTDLILTGGATTAALPSKAAALASSAGSWTKEKAIALWNKLPSLRGVTIPAINLTANTVEVDGKIIDKPSLIAQVGQTGADAIFGLATDLGMVIKQAGVTTVATGIIGISIKKFKELIALLEDSDAKPEDIKTKTEEGKKLVRQAEKEVEK